jgi:glycosyltransferase involved in cell wall biosynthesis
MSLRIAIVTSDKREFDRDYANPVPGFGAAPEALLQGFAALPEVEIHVISCQQQPVTSPEKLAANIWYHPLHVPKLGWLRTGYQGCIRAIRRKLKEIQPDIAHGQGTERECAVSAVLSGFPNVLTIHGNMRDAARTAKARFGSFYWCAARLETFALRRAAGVFCNSIYTRQIVGPRTRRVWLVPNALREPFFGKPLAAGPKPGCVLLHIGVVCENKQQLKMLGLARSLHRKQRDCEVHFLGVANPDLPYDRRFLAEVRQAEAEGCARYLGTKPVPALIECLDGASALVHTPQFEAFGLVVAEALARNLRVFGFGVGGMVDIAQDNPAAELVAAGDWGALENAILRWLQNGHPAPDPAANAAWRQYHPAAVARRHIEIYREVLSARS